MWQPLPPGVKPTGPQEINWQHPLAKGLQSYGLGLYDIAADTGLSYYSNSADQTADYLHFNDTRNKEAILLSHLGGTFFDGLAEFTFLVHVRFHGTSSADPDALIGQWSTLQGAFDADAARAEFRYRSDTDELQFFIMDSGLSSHSLQQSSSLSGGWHVLMAVMRDGYTYMYVDGVSTGAGLSTGSIVLSSATPHSKVPEVMGGHDCTGDGTGGKASPRFDMKSWGIWTRGLSDSEVFEISTSPYQLLKPAAQLLASPSLLITTPPTANATAGLRIPDPKWEEPALLQAGVKPTGPVVIDWDHPLARGSSVYSLIDDLTNEGCINLAKPNDAASYGGTAFTVSPLRIHPEGKKYMFHPSGGSSGADYIYYDPPASVEFMTMAGEYRLENVGGSANARFWYFGSSTSNDGWRMYTTTTALTLSYIDSSPAQFNTVLTYDSSVSTGDKLVVVARKNGNKIQLFVRVNDGQIQKSSETTGGNGGMRFASTNIISPTGFQGHEQLGYCHLQLAALSDSEIEEKLYHPYQFLIPA